MILHKLVLVIIANIVTISSYVERIEIISIIIYISNIYLVKHLLCDSI